jgi:hypothetical protein
VEAPAPLFVHFIAAAKKHATTNAKFMALLQLTNVIVIVMSLTMII